MFALFSFRSLRALARCGVAALALSIATSASVANAGSRADPSTVVPSVATATDRYIVKFRDAKAEPNARLSAIGTRNDKAFQYLRAMSGGAHVVRITRGAPAAGVDRTPRVAQRLVAQQLMSDPDVLYIEPDVKVYPMRVPNDPQYNLQWNYYESAGGINLPAAWDITTGSTAIVVAVIDSGIRPHVDLIGRTVPGYDFIGDTTVSNDGDGRDADPSDPGDYGSCNATSTWHGTHVSGTLGASSDNGIGVTGVNWVSKILPARVLGSCGGYTSDVVDAMRWSAGIAVAGVPTNANPARVENLSLGGADTCGNAFQSAINDVIARGTVVVVAAGNSNVDVSTTSPANCTGVIAVGATTRSGGRASFSNFGTGVTISAPGASILSTLNTGSTTPGSDSYVYYSGTSMAAPHVAGVVSLMLSQNPSLTPAQVKARLQATARAFPTGTGLDCTTSTCGAGIVDAAAALVAAPAGPRVNLALASNGTVASASSAYSSGYAASAANNGDRKGQSPGSGGYWNDASPNAFPDWLQLTFPSSKNVSEIDVFSIQDNYSVPQEPTSSMTFSLYGLIDFDVQYWDGSNWVTVPGGSITGNNLVWRKFTFQPVATTAIRVSVRRAADQWSRVAEVEAYGDSPPVNLALPANGGKASASSASAGYGASGATDGDRRGLNAGNGGYWNDATPNSFPDNLQVDFAATNSISEVDVFSVQDNYLSPSEPTASMTFSLYGLVDFDVQYWNGSSWVTLPNGSIRGNNLVWRKITFPATSTNSIRVVVIKTLDMWSRIAEVEAYSDSPSVPAPTPTPAPTSTNVALAASGSSASASSMYSGYAASGAIDGDRRGLNAGNDGYWNDATPNSFPDSLQINFAGTKAIGEVDVFSIQDNYQSPSDPTSDMTFSRYGLVDFDVQYWNGTTWVTLPNGSIRGNNLVWRKITFSSTSTNAIRVVVSKTPDMWSRVAEVEAYLAP